MQTNTHVLEIRSRTFCSKQILFDGNDVEWLMA